MLCSRMDFTSFLNWLYLSKFLILMGNFLYNLAHICNTLFWSKDVLWGCMLMSYLLLVLSSWMSQFFLRLTLYFLVKHRTSKMYIKVTVRALFSLNFCLYDSSLFRLVINLITFFWILNAFTLSPPPTV